MSTYDPHLPGVDLLLGLTTRGGYPKSQGTHWFSLFHSDVDVLPRTGPTESSTTRSDPVTTVPTGLVILVSVTVEDHSGSPLSHLLGSSPPALGVVCPKRRLDP